MKYNKLVRDNIPEYIKSKGKTAVFHVADEETYWRKLKEKLQEEVSEFLKSEELEEIADLLEVIEAVCEYKNFDRKEIEEVKNKKSEERGKFLKRIILDEP